jgi:hypothetical protein
VPGSETAASSGALTDVCSLLPLAGIPDINPKLQRYVDAAAAALKPAQAAKPTSAGAVSQAVAAALHAVELEATRSLEGTADQDDTLLNPEQFGLLTATSTALAIIQTFASSRKYLVWRGEMVTFTFQPSFFSDPALFKTCTVNLLGVLARADLSAQGIDASTLGLLDTLRATADDVIASSSDESGEYFYNAN